MSGDDLTIATFLVGLAATLGTAAMSLAGWKHKGAIVALFVAAAAAAFLGLGWPWLKGVWPRLSAVIAEIATSGVAWFVILMFGLAIALFARRPPATGVMRKEDAAEPANGSRLKQPVQGSTPVPIGRSLYVGRIHIDTGKLESDCILEFAFVAFNGSSLPLHLANMRGRVGYAKSPAAADEDRTTLPTPAIRDDNPAVFPPLSEFMIVVSQSVQGTLAAEIGRDLSTGDRVLFVLDGLDIALTAGDWPEPVRLPLWEAVTCERTRTAALVMRVATGRVNDSATPS